MSKRRTDEELLAAAQNNAKRLRERIATGSDPQLAKDVRNIRKVQAAIEARSGAESDRVSQDRYTIVIADLDWLVDRWVP